ncbi:hypothetical protein Dimus_028801 [Dionaea muscipula]
MSRTALHLLNSCHSLKSLKSIHGRLVVDGSITSSSLTLNRILRLYSRFGAIAAARKLFDEITEPNGFLWTALIHGYVENQLYSQAFSLFCSMRSESVQPLNFSLSSAFKALAREEWLGAGQAVYGLVMKLGFEFDLIVQNAAIDFFMRCNKVDFATRVFGDMIEKDIISWNSMISGYGNMDRVDDARELFDEMPERNVISWTSMIRGYIKVGNMIEARSLFEVMPTKDLASWNVMVAGYMDVGDVLNARLIVDRMPVLGSGAWNVVISGFCKAGDLESAEKYFDQMPNKNVASWSMMVDGYIKAGNMVRAKSLFDQMPEKNLVAWSTMIYGYARHGLPRDSLSLFEQFKELGMRPDDGLIMGVIIACSQLGVLQTAESIICKYMEPAHFSNLQLLSCLIDMYAKCGSIQKALQMFKMTSQKDLHCYTTMILAFANHGLGQEALSLFDEMLNERIVPDEICFLAVLSACNHRGLVDEGRRCFRLMIEEFGIQPTEKHYACMVDLLGRAGHLEDAYSLIIDMPIFPSSVVWSALLAVSRINRNAHLAEVATAELLKIEPQNSGNYALLSDVYAASRRWDDVAEVRAMIRERRVRKNRGSSWIELDCIVHEFVTSDEYHASKDAIYFILDLLIEDMRLSGYSAVDSEDRSDPADFFLTVGSNSNCSG